MKHSDVLRFSQSIVSCTLPAWRNRVRRRILVIPRGASLEDQRMMKRAIELGRAAGERGEVPVGAVIYRAGVILSAASNKLAYMMRGYCIHKPLSSEGKVNTT